MLHCAIRGCNVHEMFLRSGSLQLLDVRTEDNRIVRKMVWFCPECSEKYVVQSWRPANEQIRVRASMEPFILADIHPAA